MNDFPSSPRRNRRRDIARYGIYARHFTDEELDFLDQGNAAFCDYVESAVRPVIARFQASIAAGELSPRDLTLARSAISSGEAALRSLASIRNLPDILKTRPRKTDA